MRKIQNAILYYKPVTKIGEVNCFISENKKETAF